jgi:hypothetical protein
MKWNTTNWNMRREEDSAKTIGEGLEFEAAVCMYVPRHKVQWQLLLNTVMNLSIP